MQEFLGKKLYTKEENKQLISDLKLYKQLKKEEYDEERDQAERLGALLLDSSLIFPCKNEIYTHKIIECGDYYKVYTFFKRSIKLAKNVEKETFQKEKVMKKLLKSDDECKKEEAGRSPPKSELKKIDEKNIRRAKNEMINLVKANENKFKTFVTLTFEDIKYEEISLANKKFDIWRTNIKSLFRDFAYVCVPEFQKKRGRKTGHYVVHYHLLTNLEINDNLGIIIPQKKFTEKQFEEMTEEQRKKCYDVKFWSYGYSSVFSVKNINIVGYMSKYMTKDVDNRLWGKRRYLASRNLKRPSTVYLDEKEFRDWLRLTSIETSMNLTYSNVYNTKVTNEPIMFQEYKRVKESDLNVSSVS